VTFVTSVPSFAYACPEDGVDNRYRVDGDGPIDFVDCYGRLPLSRSSIRLALTRPVLPTIRARAWRQMNRSDCRSVCPAR
jgi:hypothetical protein